MLLQLLSLILSASPSGAAATPPRRLPQRRGDAGLHKRNPSKQVVLTVTPSTPPNATRMAGAASAATYRLIPESPNAPRIAAPSFRKPPAQPEWAKGGKGGWTRRRTLLLVCLAVGVLVLVGHRQSGYSASWLRGDADDEPDTYGRAHSVHDEAVAESARLKGMDEHGRPGGEVEKPVQVWHHAPEQAHAPGSHAQGDGHDRFVKVSAEDRPAKVPTHDLEVTSATDPDASQRFILVGWMGEQETKAQAHLYQLGLLSLALNRTLVLPNVKRSRFGTCYRHPFSLYYAADTLTSFGFNWIPDSEFWDWTERQRSPPTAQTIALVRGSPGPVEDVVIPSRRMCLSDKPLDFSQHEPKAFFSPLSDWKSDEIRFKFGEQVVTGLLPDSASSDRDESSLPPSAREAAVLVAQVNLRYPMLDPPTVARLSPFDFPLPAPYSYFPYSPHWTALGHAIASHLSPFVAVHWRTETLEVDRLAPCGHALVSKLREIRRAHPEIKTLYLATDYPLEILRADGAAGNEGKATAHSGTMTKTLTPGHHAAMRDFLEELEGEGGAGLRMTSFLDEQGKVEWPQELQEAMGRSGAKLEELDGAIVGIVDKIVLMAAELFYAGLPVSSPTGCGKYSQFTTQVITGRRDALRLADDRGEDTTLMNEAGHFFLDAPLGGANEEDKRGEAGKKLKKGKKAP
ncbi:hypothetical protein JCM6882_003332 [Rhodosporidiobolus microsporus]